MSDYSDLTLSDDQILYILNTFCYDSGCSLLETNLSKLFLYAAEHEKTCITEQEMDTVLEKENVLKNPVAQIWANMDYFSETDQAIVNTMILKSKSKDKTGRAEVCADQVKYIAEIVRSRPRCETFCFEKFMENVNRTHYGMEDAKLAFARAFRHYAATGYGSSLLFVSAPGEGKTSLAESAASAFGIPFVKISCNGINDANALKGTLSSVHGGGPGRIMDAISVVGKDGAVLVLDELDKINASGTGYAVVSALLDLLDDSRSYSAAYFDGIRFNLQKVIIVGTANHAELIPPELLDRFEVVNLKGGGIRKQKKSISCTNM